jgi:hypothetical protein
MAPQRLCQDDINPIFSSCFPLASGVLLKVAETLYGVRG